MEENEYKDIDKQTIKQTKPGFTVRGLSIKLGSSLGMKRGITHVGVSET